MFFFFFFFFVSLLPFPAKKLSNKTFICTAFDSLCKFEEEQQLRGFFQLSFVSCNCLLQSPMRLRVCVC